MSSPLSYLQYPGSNLNLDMETKAWARDVNGWRIAPAGRSWIKEGSLLMHGPHCTFGSNGTRLGNRVQLGAGAVIGNHVTIGDGCTTGAAVTLADGCTLEHGDVIGAGSCLGEDSRVGGFVSIGAHSWIGDRCRIGRRATLGAHSRVGRGCVIGPDTSIGDSASIGCDATGIIDLGVTDGYRKVLAWVNGEPYIGAGCRWFSFRTAELHWRNHDEDRRATLAQLAFAAELIKLRG